MTTMKERATAKDERRAIVVDFSAFSSNEIIGKTEEIRNQLTFELLPSFHER